MGDNIEYRCTMICDNYVELPGGKRISHAEYNFVHGTNYQPGPLTVKFDHGKPQGIMLLD